MRKKIYSTLIAFIFAIPLGMGHLSALTPTKTPTTKIAVNELDPKYKEWLELVHYIITPTEKEVFNKLTNNRDRDSFITMFWNLRDPSKGTPENEFKEEHIKRFQYASHYFKFGSPLPGWKTDRGRIWILLGPPVSRNEVDNSDDLYPVEIWEYYGGVDKGLPTVFRVVFYKRNGSGDFKLYIPSEDGPYSLLRVSVGAVDPNNFESIYDKINEAEPQVAEICLSLIPGESIHDFQPSLQAPILISQIFELPKKQINATYAKNFLNYKGMVETSVVTNYINVKSDYYLFYDPILKLNFVHFALLPEKISVDYLEEKDQYYFNYDLMVFIKNGDNTIYQYTKKFPFYYSKEDLDKKISNGVIITDYFPVVSGDFKFIAILENSLNKELSYYEKDFKSVHPSTSNTPLLFGPLTTYQLLQEPQPVYSAFSVLDDHIKIDPQKYFGLADTITAFFSVDRGTYTQPLQIRLELLSEDENRPFQKTYTFALPANEHYKNFSQAIEKLPYGNYSTKVTLLDEAGKALITRDNDFQVSPESHVPHPPLASKTLKRENNFLFYMSIAEQYCNLNKTGEAELFFEKAFQINAAFPELLKSYANLLFKLKKYDRIMEIIKNLENNSKDAFDYFSIKGRALYYLGKNEEAVDSLLKANKIYDSDTAVLNALGLSFIRLNNKEEAIRVLNASLKLNDQQQDIVSLLKQLQEKPKKTK